MLCTESDLLEQEPSYSVPHLMEQILFCYVLNPIYWSKIRHILFCIPFNGATSVLFQVLKCLKY